MPAQDQPQTADKVCLETALAPEGVLVVRGENMTTSRVFAVAVDVEAIDEVRVEGGDLAVLGLIDCILQDFENRLRKAMGV